MHIMNESVKKFAEICAGSLEVSGILIIIIFALWSTVNALVQKFKRQSEKEIYNKYRHQLARGILLGLEFLVAADIIHTVAVDLSFTSVGILAAVVLIRTFLSFTLEMEISGKWPWQTRK
jgi:uncharacterized membrane protein